MHEHVEQLLDEILEGVYLITESASDFDQQVQMQPQSRRKGVIRNNMDYLLTVVEERHRNGASMTAAAAGGADIRFSVKDCYRKLFEDEGLSDPKINPKQ